MAVKAVLFDAYGTLLESDLVAIPRRIVADHGLAVSVEEVWRAWANLYYEATQVAPFRTLREIEVDITARLLRELGVDADCAPYVELFFQLTTTIQPYPETLDVLTALPPVRSAIISNADEEHLAAWTVTFPVEFVLISEAARSYKPDPRMFHVALERLGLRPDEVLHVGDSEVDDVVGAKAAGLRVAWVNRNGRALRSGLPRPDFEIADLKGLLAVL
jgi:2-haloalkanoic acid dehalogenase type II